MLKTVTFKAFASVLILVLLASLFAGCTKKEKENQPSQSAAASEPAATESAASEEPSEEPKPPEEVSIMFIDVTGFKYTNVLKIYEKMMSDLNIKLKITTVGEGEVVDKLTAMAASNSLPDIMLNWVGLDVINPLGDKGVFLPINDYLDQMPHLKAELESRTDTMNMLTSENGKLYRAPMVNLGFLNSIGIGIRADLLKQQNVDVGAIKTVDDFYAALLALKEANGGKAPYGTRAAGAEFNHIAKIFGVQSMRYTGDIQFNPNSKQYESPIFSQGLKDAVQFIANMYKDGILAKDFVSMNDQQWDTANKVGEKTVFIDGVSNTAHFNKALQDSGVNSEYISLVPPEYNGKVQPWRQSPELMSWFGFVVSANAPNKDAALRLVDWFYNRDNIEFVGYGIEGESFTRDADGRPVSKFADMGAEGTKLVTEVWGTGQNFNFLGYLGAYPGVPWDKSALMTPVSPESLAAEATLVDVSKKFYTAPVDPLVSFTAEENEQLKQLQASLDTYIQEGVFKFILGQQPMSKWEAFTEEVKKQDIDKVLEIYNAAYARKYK